MDLGTCSSYVMKVSTAVYLTENDIEKNHHELILMCGRCSPDSTAQLQVHHQHFAFLLSFLKSAFVISLRISLDPHACEVELVDTVQLHCRFLVIAMQTAFNCKSKMLSTWLQSSAVTTNR